MVARNVHDTVRDKDIVRVRAHKDGEGRKVLDYSDGTEITTERTAPGWITADGRPALKEVRTITKVKTPPTRVFGGFGDGTYDRKLIAKEEGARDG